MNHEGPQSAQLNVTSQGRNNSPPNFSISFRQMIMEAIELNQPEGANESSISKYIESKYGEMAAGHADLLTTHLNQMKGNGEILLINNNYLRPSPDTPLKRRRGRPVKAVPKGIVRYAPPRVDGHLYDPRKRPAPHLASQQTKIARPTTQTTPTKATPNIHSIFHTKYIQGVATSSDSQVVSNNNYYEEKLKVLALHQAQATAALSDLMLEIQARPPSSVLTELEDLKREMSTARVKEKDLESTITELTQKNKEISSQCASYEIQAVTLRAENKKTKEELTVAYSKKKELEATISAQCASYESQIVDLKVENKKTEEELMVACSKGRELEATISELMHKNKSFSEQCASYESRVVALEAEYKKTKEELMVARSKEKEHKDTISRLTHKNKVLSAECSSYECQIVALEAENMKTKQELMVADEKFYSGARAAGYAEGLREGKTKWLKSVEFLHHLTDASMQYFDYGFDSCQKQAEQQGFMGQLNKDSSLKKAPKLKGWE